MLFDMMQISTSRVERAEPVFLDVVVVLALLACRNKGKRLRQKR